MISLRTHLPPRVVSRLEPLLPIVLISSALALVPGTTCLLKLAVHQPCPACGFTRATIALLRGRFTESFLLHPLVIPFGLGVSVAVVLAWVFPDEDPRWKRFQEVSTALASVGFLLVWALRLLGVLPSV